MLSSVRTGLEGLLHSKAGVAALQSAAALVPGLCTAPGLACGPLQSPGSALSSRAPSLAAGAPLAAAIAVVNHGRHASRQAVWSDPRSCSGSASISTTASRCFATTAAGPFNSSSSSSNSSTLGALLGAAAAVPAAQPPVGPRAPTQQQQQQQRKRRLGPPDLSIQPTMPTRMILKALHTSEAPPTSHQLWEQLKQQYPDSAFASRGRKYLKDLLKLLSKRRWVKARPPHAMAGLAAAAPGVQQHHHLAAGGSGASKGKGSSKRVEHYVYVLTRVGAVQPMDPPPSLFKTAVDEGVAAFLASHQLVEPGAQQQQQQVPAGVAVAGSSSGSESGAP